MCPLHNAGFSIKTGKPDQGPVFNGLKTFDTEVKDGKIIVKVPKDTWNQPPPVFNIDPSKLKKDKRVVIIGAGPAALSAADTLRQCGYDGYIYMVTKEKCTLLIYPRNPLRQNNAEQNERRRKETRTHQKPRVLRQKRNRLRA
jgi:hypothetical protein